MYTQFDSNKEKTETVLKALASSWKERVAVRKDILDLDLAYDIKVPDFPESYLPFGYDERYLSLSDDLRMSILSAAWIFYNEKTIAVETEIVAPVCKLLIKGAYLSSVSASLQRTISQTLVDEEYHTLMCLEACQVARKRRNLERIRFPFPNVVQALYSQVEKCNSMEEEHVVRLAFAVIAETTINAYLGLLSENKEIQRLNSAIVKLHKQDESGHSVIFREIAARVVFGMNPMEKKIFVESLKVGLDSFVSFDSDCYRAILHYFKITDTEKIIDSIQDTYQGPSMKRDYSSFVGLVQKMGFNADVVFAGKLNR